jgi:hypothetical protein
MRVETVVALGAAPYFARLAGMNPFGTDASPTLSLQRRGRQNARGLNEYLRLLTSRGCQHPA